MCNYGDQTRCKNLDSASQLEKGQTGYLLKDPRITGAVDLAYTCGLEDLASWYFVQ